MKAHLIFILIISIMGLACTSQKSKTLGQWSEKELSEWFSKGEWKQGWDARPDESVKHKEVTQLYYENQERWDKANDDFLPGMEYIRKCGYDVNETETVPYV